MLAGARPGDPLADLVFNLAFVLVQQELFTFLEESGLSVRVPVAEASGVFPAPPGAPVELVPVPPATFMDDLAMALEAATTALVLRDVSTAVVGMARIAARYGLILNFSPGKTEAVVHPAGEGSVASLGDLPLAPDPPPGQVVRLLALPTGASLRLVSCYKHSGGLVSAARAV